LIDSVDRTKLEALLAQGKKFKFIVEGIGRHISMAEQLHLINMFKAFSFRDANVDLSHPEQIFKVIENTESRECFFGLQVASQRESEHSGKNKNDDTFFWKYSLKKRPYLGPTSTDHELAFLMANQAECQEGQMVYDPFCGTGSIAIAMTHFKTQTVGSDLDMRVLKGYGVGRKTRNKIDGLDKIDKFNVFTNFDYYGLPRPEILAMDVSALMFNLREVDYRSVRPLFDAIVCDPPYGVRARSQKVGIRESKKQKPEKPSTEKEDD
jgi:tRNA (guanine10-N2)-methyltransferase